MRKRLTFLQEKRIAEAKETFGSTLFVEHKEIARLRFPDDFPTNMARLCNGLAVRAQLALHDIVMLMQLMPKTYTAKILATSEFDAFMYRVMQNMDAVDDKKPDARLTSTTDERDKIESGIEEGEVPYSFRLSVTMLNRALENIIKTMPDEFHESLKIQIFPFVTLVNAIANYSQSGGKGKRKKTPRLYLPFDITPSSVRNANLSTPR